MLSLNFSPATFFLFLFFGCTIQQVGSYFPNQGLNLCPLHCKHGVLTTGPPGKSPDTSLVVQ